MYGFRVLEIVPSWLWRHLHNLSVFQRISLFRTIEFCRPIHWVYFAEKLELCDRPLQVEDFIPSITALCSNFANSTCYSLVDNYSSNSCSKPASILVIENLSSPLKGHRFFRSSLLLCDDKWIFRCLNLGWRLLKWIELLCLVSPSKSSSSFEVQWLHLTKAWSFLSQGVSVPYSDHIP